MRSAREKTMPDFCSRRNPLHYITALSVLERLGIDTDRVDLLAVGEYENYRGEIRSQKPAPGTPISEDAPLALEVGHPSAVDYMPYQMFYGLSGVGGRTGAWEDQARTFMAPFDAAVIRYFARAMHHSLRFSLCMRDQHHLLRFLALLDFDPWREPLDIDEIVFWVSVMPTYHGWAGNPHLVERLLSRVFGYDFRIVENAEAEYDIPAGVQSRLGASSAKLGQTCLVGRSFRERDSCYHVQVRGVPPGDACELLPGGRLRRKLEWLLTECMPNNLDGRIRLQVDRRPLVIGGNSPTALVGFSTYI